MSVAAILGAQWGDEGKGKLVDLLAADYDLVARFNGGANAGHTLYVNGVKYALHLVPCGILYPGKLNIIGNGTVLHIPTLLKELELLRKNGISYEDTMKISDRAHILFDFHQIIDGLEEARRADNQIGTTKRGIGPCYSSKMNRNGIRIGELVGEWHEFESRYRDLASSLISMYGFKYDLEGELQRFKQYREILKNFIVDTVCLVNQSWRSGKKILAEGANAAMLDIDHGTYPFVTSSATTTGGICSGLGIAPNKIGETIGVVKAYTTRVGDGPFPSELSNKESIGEHLRSVGREFGTTTGRPRRCGWLDIPVVRFAAMVGGLTSINLTKIDVLCGLKEVKIGVKYIIDGKPVEGDRMPSTISELSKVEMVYEVLPGWSEDISAVRKLEDLPQNAQKYIARVQELIGVPIAFIGVGPSRDDMIVTK